MGNILAVTLVGLMVFSGFAHNAHAQSAGPANLHEVSNDAPESYAPAYVRSTALPNYTDDGRRLHIEGSVIVRVVVNANGSMAEAKVIRGLGYGLDEKALESLRASKFSAAVRNGIPVQESIDVAVNFRLR